MQISELLEKLKAFHSAHLVMLDTEDFLHSVITVKYDPVAQAVVIANYPEHRSSPFDKERASSIISQLPG